MGRVAEFEAELNLEADISEDFSLKLLTIDPKNERKLIYTLDEVQNTDH